MTDYKSKTVLYWDNGLFIERHHARPRFRQGALLRAVAVRPIPHPTSRSSATAFPASSASIIPGRTSTRWTCGSSRRVRRPDPGVSLRWANGYGAAAWARSWSWIAPPRRVPEEVGIDIGPWKLVTGIKALRKHRKRHDDQWVKISATRGDGGNVPVGKLRPGEAADATSGNTSSAPRATSWSSSSRTASPMRRRRGRLRRLHDRRQVRQRRDVRHRGQGQRSWCRKSSSTTPCPNRCAL